MELKEKSKAKKTEIEKIEKDKNMIRPDWYKGWLFTGFKI